MRKVKPLALAALALFLLLPGLLSCADVDPKDSLARIKKSGVIILGTSADYPPYEFHKVIDGVDQIVGFDIEVARAIAGELNLKLIIRDIAFDGLLAALEVGAVDFVAAGMTPTVERTIHFDFSKIYYTADQGFAVRAADKAKYPDAASLRSAVIGVQQGAIQAGMAKVRIKGWPESDVELPHPEIRELVKVSDLIDSLKAGSVDAVLVELAVAEAYVKKNRELALAPFSFADTQGGSAIAVRKGEGRLLAAIDKTLSKLLGAKAVKRYAAEANALYEED